MLSTKGNRNYLYEAELPKREIGRNILKTGNFMHPQDKTDRVDNKQRYRRPKEHI